MAVAGCQGGDTAPRVPMSGKVTLKGVPLSAGSVSLLPEKGTDAPTANTMINRGEYRFNKANGPLAGRYRLLVMYSEETGKGGKAGLFQITFTWQAGMGIEGRRSGLQCF